MEALPKRRCCTIGGRQSRHLEGKLVTEGPRARVQGEGEVRCEYAEQVRFYEPELEGDIALDKEVRGIMRSSHEAAARLREARARRAEFENKMRRVRRVRFDMRLQVCGWTLGTFTVPPEDDPEHDRVATSKWKKAVEWERVRLPPAGRQMMSASEKQPRQNVARVRYPACDNGLVFKELATWADLMANYKSPKFIFWQDRPKCMG